MADKEDTWSWWDVLKAGAAAALLGMPGASMARGQYRAGKLNAINEARGPAQSGLKKISETRQRLAEKTGRSMVWNETARRYEPADVPNLPDLGRAADKALNDYFSARRAVRDLESQIADNRARASATAQRRVLDHAAPVYREIAALREAGVPVDPVHFGVERYSDMFGRDGKVSFRSVPAEDGLIYPFAASRSNAIAVPWTPDVPGPAKPEQAMRATDWLREQRASKYIEGAERTILKKAIEDMAVAKMKLHPRGSRNLSGTWRRGPRDTSGKKTPPSEASPLQEFNDMRQEVLELQEALANPERTLFSGDPLTAVNLRNYYAFRRAYRASHGSPGNLMLPTGVLPPDKGLLQTSFRSGEGAAATPPSGPARVQGPFERVAKIAASYTIPGYNVGPARVRKGPDGKERPTRLDTAQNWVAGSKWPQRISKGALGVSLAGAGVWWLNHRNQLKKNEREVKAMGDQQRSELAQMLTNVVQVASAANPNEAYGQAGLNKLVAGVAAARGLGQTDAADGLLARVPADALYMYGSQMFNRISPASRAELGFGGRGALDLSDEEMHEFARRHLGAMADQRLYQWTNSVPPAVGGDK